MESNLELEESLPDSSLAGSREADLNSLLAAILLNIRINSKKCWAWKKQKPVLDTLKNERGIYSDKDPKSFVRIRIPHPT